MQLLLIRHTPVGVESGLCYGRLDVPLAADADRHIADVQRRLVQFAGASAPVCSSPSSRCVRLARVLDADAVTDDRLLEFDFGDWEGRTWDTLPRAEVDAWAGDVATVRVPGGESLHDVLARARACVDTWTARAPARLVLVTHGGVIRALLSGLLALPLSSAPRFHVAFGGISRIDVHDGHAELRFLNA